jgi:hypothetical protein
VIVIVPVYGFDGRRQVYTMTVPTLALEGTGRTQAAAVLDLHQKICQEMNDPDGKHFEIRLDAGEGK